MKQLVAFIFSLSAIGVTNAVEYELPTGSNVAFAQLQSLTDYSTLCDTELSASAVCDVEPGDYQLVVFDTSGNPETSIVTVAASSSSGTGSSSTGNTGSAQATSPVITLVTESCFGGPNTQMGCTAFCPSGTVATGGACDVSFGFTVSSVAGQDFYRCPTALPPNDTSVGVTASVYCLGLQ